MKKGFLLLLVLVLLPLGSLAGPVYYTGETEPFAEDAELLTIRFAGLVGGDCMLVTCGEHSMFVDLGTDSSLEKINEVIRAAGIDRVEYFYNTHPHCDHIGGLKPLLESGFPVGAMITFFPHDYLADSVLQPRAVNAANEYHVPIIDMKTGDTIPFGNVQLTAYRVPDDRILRAMGPNDLSAMLMIKYGDCSMLISGDVENRSQSILPGIYDLKADILKFPHHGAEPMRSVFLRAVDPEYVVITHNPGETVKAQQHLRNNGKNRITFTAWGIITLQTDGQKWIVSQEIYPGKEKHIKEFLKENQWLHPWMTDGHKPYF